MFFFNGFMFAMHIVYIIRRYDLTADHFCLRKKQNQKREIMLNLDSLDKSKQYKLCLYTKRLNHCLTQKIFQLF